MLPLTTETQTSSNNSAMQVFSTQPPSIVGVGHTPPTNSDTNRLGYLLAHRVSKSAPAVPVPSNNQTLSLAERLAAAQLRQRKEDAQLQSPSYVPPEPIPEELLQYARGRRQSSTPQLQVQGAWEEAATPLSSGPRSHESSSSGVPTTSPPQQKPKRSHQASLSDSSAGRYRVLAGGRSTPQMPLPSVSTPKVPADRRRSSGSSTFNSSQVATPNTHELLPQNQTPTRHQQRRSSPGHEFPPARRTSLYEVIGAAIESRNPMAASTSVSYTPKTRPQAAPRSSDSHGDPNPSFAVSQPTESRKSSQHGNYELSFANSAPSQQATTPPTTDSMYNSRGSQLNPSVSDDALPAGRPSVVEPTAKSGTPLAANHHTVPTGRRTSEALSSNSNPSATTPQTRHSASLTPLLETAQGRTAEGSQVNSSITEAPGGRGRSVHETTTTTAYSEELLPPSEVGATVPQLPPFPAIGNRRETLPNAVEDMHTFRFPAEASSSASHGAGAQVSLGDTTDTEPSFHAARKLSATVPRNTGLLPSPEVAAPQSARDVSSSFDLNRHDSGGDFPSRLHTHTISPSDAIQEPLAAKSSDTAIVDERSEGRSQDIAARQGEKEEEEGKVPALNSKNHPHKSFINDEAFGNTVATIGVDSSPSYQSLPPSVVHPSPHSPLPTSRSASENNNAKEFDTKGSKRSVITGLVAAEEGVVVTTIHPAKVQSTVVVCQNTSASLTANVSTGPEDTTNTTTTSGGTHGNSSGYAAAGSSSKSGSERTPTTAPLPPLAYHPKPKANARQGASSGTNGVQQPSASKSGSSNSYVTVESPKEATEESPVPISSFVGGILEMLEAIKVATDLLVAADVGGHSTSTTPQGPAGSPDSHTIAPLSIHSLDKSNSYKRSPAGMVDTPRAEPEENNSQHQGLKAWLQSRQQKRRQQESEVVQNSTASFGNVSALPKLIDSPKGQSVDSPLTPPRTGMLLPSARPPIPGISSTRTSLASSNPHQILNEVAAIGGSGQSSASNALESVVTHSLPLVGPAVYSAPINLIPLHKNSLNANSSTTGSDLASVHPDRFAHSVYSVGSQTLYSSGVNGDSFPSALANSPSGASFGTGSSPALVASGASPQGNNSIKQRHFHKTHFNPNTPHLSDGRGRMFMALRSNFEASHLADRERLQQHVSSEVNSPQVALATPGSEEWGGSVLQGSKMLRQAPTAGSSQRQSGVGGSSTDIESNISPRDQALPAPLTGLNSNGSGLRASGNNAVRIAQINRNYPPLHTPSEGSRDTPAAGTASSPQQRMQNSIHSFETSSGTETMWNIPSGPEDFNATTRTSTSASKGPIEVLARNFSQNANASSDASSPSTTTGVAADSPFATHRHRQTTTSSFSSGSGRPPQHATPSKGTSSSSKTSTPPLPRQGAAANISISAQGSTLQKESTSSYFGDNSSREILGANASASTGQTTTTAATTPMMRPPIPMPSTSSSIHKSSTASHFGLNLTGKATNSASYSNNDEKLILVGSVDTPSTLGDATPGTSLQDHILSFPLTQLDIQAALTPNGTLNDSTTVAPGMLNALASSTIRMGNAPMTPLNTNQSSASKKSSHSSVNSLMPTITVSPSMALGAAVARQNVDSPKPVVIEGLGTTNSPSGGGRDAPLAERLKGLLLSRKQDGVPEGNRVTPLALRMKAAFAERKLKQEEAVIQPSTAIQTGSPTQSDEVLEGGNRKGSGSSAGAGHPHPSPIIDSGNSSYHSRPRHSSTERDTLGAKLASSSGTMTSADQNSRRQSGGTSGTNMSNNTSFANNSGSPVHSTPKKTNLIPPSMHALRPTSPNTSAQGGNIVDSLPATRPSGSPVKGATDSTLVSSTKEKEKNIPTSHPTSLENTTVIQVPDNSDLTSKIGRSGADSHRNRLSSSMSHSQHSQHSRRVNPSGVASPTQQLLQPRYGPSASKGYVSRSGSGFMPSPSATPQSKPASPYSPTDNKATPSTSGMEDAMMNSSSQAIGNDTPMGRVLQRVMSAGGEPMRSPTSPSSSMHRSFGSIIRSPRNVHQNAAPSAKHHASNSGGISGSTQPPLATSTSEQRGLQQISPNSNITASHVAPTAANAPPVASSSSPKDSDLGAASGALESISGLANTGGHNNSNTTNSSSNATNNNIFTSTPTPPNVVTVRSTSAVSDGPSAIAYRAVGESGSPYRLVSATGVGPSIMLPETSLAATSSNSIQNAFSSGSSHETVNPRHQNNQSQGLQATSLGATTKSSATDLSSPNIAPSTSEAKAAFSVSASSGAPVHTHNNTPMTEHSVATIGINVSSTSLPPILSSITDPTIPPPVAQPTSTLLDSTSASASHPGSDHPTGTQTGNSSPRYLAGTLTKEPTPEPNRYHALPPSYGYHATTESYSPPPRRAHKHNVPPPLLQVPKSPPGSSEVPTLLPPPVSRTKLAASKELLEYLRTEDFLANARKQTSSPQLALQLAEGEVAKLNIKFYIPIVSVCDMDRLAKPPDGAPIGRQLSNASEHYDPFGATYTSLGGSSKFGSRMHSPRVGADPNFSSRPTSPAGQVATGSVVQQSKSPLIGRPPIGPHSTAAVSGEGVYRTSSVACSHRSTSRKSSAGGSRLKREKDEAIMAANPQFDWSVLSLKEDGRNTRVGIATLAEYVRLAGIALARLENGVE